MKKIVLFVCIFLSVLSVKSQLTQLNHSLMQGGNVNQFVSNGSNIFISTDGGVFKTSNNGTSWTYCNFNSILSNSATDIVVTNGNLYAALDNDYTHIYQSTDNGATWTSSGNPTSTGWFYDLGGPVNSKVFRFYFKIDQSGNNNDSVYLFNTNVPSGTWVNGAFIGVDAGYTTNFLNISNTKQFFQLGGNLFFTSDGVTITQVPTVPGLVNGFDETALTSEPSNNLIYYNNRDDGNVYKMDLTTTLQWVNIRNNITTNPAMQILNLVAADNLLLTLGVDTLNNAKYMRSLNHGVTFDTVPLYNCGIIAPRFDDIFKVSSTSLFASGGMNKNLYHSTDNGTTWTVINTGFFGLNTTDLVQKGDSLLTYVDEGRGVMRSLDGGVTWNLSNTGISTLYNIVNCSDIFKLVGNNVFAIADIVSTTQRGTLVYKSADFGATWTPTTSQPVAKTVNMTYEGKNGNLGVFVHNVFIDSTGNYKTGVFRTINNGNTWTKINAGLVPFGINNLFGVNGKGLTDTLLLFADDFNGNDMILISTNNGDTWTLSYTVTNGNIELNQGIYGKAVTAFGGPTNSAVVVITDYSTGVGVDKILMLGSNGWKNIPNSGLPSGVQINSIKYMNNMWYVGTTAGVYRSADLISWNALNNSGIYLGMTLSNLQLSTTSNTLYVATAGNSLWKTDVTYSINEFSKSNDNFSIYPVPAKDKLNIVFKSDKLPLSFDIISLEGKLLKTQIINYKETTINVSDLSLGVYLIKMNYTDKQIVEKFTVLK